MKQTVYVSKNGIGKWFVPLLITELAGMGAGSFMAFYFRESDIMQSYICPELFGGTAFEIFSGTLITSLLFLGLSFFFGLCVFGQPVGIALLIAVGAELSCSASLIYSERGISGLPAVLLLCLPKTAAISAVGILSVRELMRTSTGILKSVISAGEPPCFRRYCLRFGVLALAVLIISLSDALINNFFRVRL